MAKSASFIQYMRAHGNTPGPTQRPVLAGAVTGALAQIPAVLVLWWSGALSSATQTLSLSMWVALALHLLATIVAGAIYGRVFSRAANDPRGGWLFGISYGFLIWMIGPVTILQWTLGQPIALGGGGNGHFRSISHVRAVPGFAVSLDSPVVASEAPERTERTRRIRS